MKVSDEVLSMYINHGSAFSDIEVAIALELIELRAAAAKSESYPAVVRHYTGCKYPVIKVGGLEVAIAGEREDADELAEYINSLQIATAPEPAK